jgi:nucleoside-diphosphate-sugar epimerase
VVGRPASTLDDGLTGLHVLVTGGLGFVDSVVDARLAATGHQATVLTHSTPPARTPRMASR